MKLIDSINRRLVFAAFGKGGGNTATFSVLRDADSITLLASNGEQTVLPSANPAEAGVISAADKSKLDGVEPGATGDQTGAEIITAINMELGGTAWQAGGEGIATNLSLDISEDMVVLQSDTGGDAVLPAATATAAGVMTVADKIKLDGLSNALATPTSDGLMSAADKTKLDGLGSGGQSGGDMAAAIYDPQGIAGDAFDRANHSGEQPIGSVIGLQAALDGKAAASHGHGASAIISGTLLHERGGLEADVSAYNGLVKISGGSTSQAVPGTDYAAAVHSHTQSQLTGLRTTDSPQFAAINLGHATDTTLARSVAGQMTIEGVQVLTASNTATVTNKLIDAAQLTGTVSVNRFNGGAGASALTYLRGDGTWATPAGGSAGDVTKIGTPVANRMAYWTGDGTLGHEAGFTYDPATDTLTITKIVIGGVTFDGQNQLIDPNADRLMGWDDTAGATAFFAPTNGIEISGTSLQMTANQRTSAIEFVIDGGGASIIAGMKGFIQVPFACTITAARLLADQAGSIVVDIWKDSFANYPPTEAASITGSARPTISSGTKSEDTGLAGWATSIAAGDILGFNVDSASAVTRVTVVLIVAVS